MRVLRTLFKRMPGGGNSRGPSPEYGQGKVYFLYALRPGVPPEGKELQQAVGFYGRAEIEKALRRQKREPAVFVAKGFSPVLLEMKMRWRAAGKYGILFLEMGHLHAPTGPSFVNRSAVQMSGERRRMRNRNGREDNAINGRVHAGLKTMASGHKGFAVGGNV